MKRQKRNVNQTHPITGKLLKFELAETSGSCCWVLRDRKRGGEPYSISIPGVYEPGWSIKSIKVTECELNEMDYVQNELVSDNHNVNLNEQCVSDNCVVTESAAVIDNNGASLIVGPPTYDGSGSGDAPTTEIEKPMAEWNSSPNTNLPANNNISIQGETIAQGLDPNSGSSLLNFQYQIFIIFIVNITYKHL